MYKDFSTPKRTLRKFGTLLRNFGKVWKFYNYYDKEYFKNNIKIIIALKRRWIKNNFETTITNCGFKDISETFKTIVTKGGFLH